MANRTATAKYHATPQDDALHELGRGLVAQIMAEEPRLEPGLFGEADLDAAAAGVRLALDDLIRDDNGEVVLYNDSGLRVIGIDTDADLVGRGEALPHVTASGEDVTGFHFLAFDNGLTLYYQEGLEVVVHHHPT